MRGVEDVAPYNIKILFCIWDIMAGRRGRRSLQYKGFVWVFEVLWRDAADVVPYDVFAYSA